MDLSIFQITSLAFVQGITEFLPVSSSGHLALAPFLFGFDDPGLAFSASLHVGTLLAVIVYFWSDLTELVKSVFAQNTEVTTGGEKDKIAQNRQMVVALIIATVPAVFAGLLWEDVVAGLLRTPEIIGGLLVAGSLTLYLVDKYASSKRAQSDVNLRDGVVVGLAQALAIVPGVSRSGMTMAAGRLLGLSRETATRFSFLMAIPIIAGATVLELPKVIEQGFGVMMLFGIAVSFVVAYSTIALFLRFIAQISFVWFVWYSLLLAVVILMLVK